MLSALQTSLTGLLSAGNRAKLAAENIMRASAEGANALEATDVVSAGRAYGEAVVVGSNSSSFQPSPAYGPTNRTTAAGTDGQPGLVESIVDLKLAAQAYKANAVAIRAADKTLSRFIKEI